MGGDSERSANGLDAMPDGGEATNASPNPFAGACAAGWDADGTLHGSDGARAGATTGGGTTGGALISGFDAAGRPRRIGVIAGARPNDAAPGDELPNATTESYDASASGARSGVWADGAVGADMDICSVRRGVEHACARLLAEA